MTGARFDHLNPSGRVTTRTEVWVSDRPIIRTLVSGTPDSARLTVTIEAVERTAVHLVVTDPDAAADLAAALTWAATRARALAGTHGQDGRIFTPDIPRDAS